jgi:hypothetical protein
MTTSQIQAEAPHYDAVWGSYSPSTWDGSHPGMYVTRYFLPNEDSYNISGHDLSWFKTNHPDWVLYACQSDGTPTQDQPWSGTGFPNDVPLDIHNPAVVQYLLQELGQYASSHGYNAVALDNVDLTNYMLAPNHILGQGSTQPGWYACGIYQNGTFVRRYSGGYNAADPTWIADMKNFVAQAHSYFNSTYHMKVLMNHPLSGSSPTADEAELLQNVDGMLDENGYTHYGSLYTGNTFAATLNWMEYAQSHNRAIFITDYYCSGSACSKDPSTLTASQVDWALASYALGNNGGAGLFVSPKGGAIYTYRNEYSTTYGKPCGAFTQGGFYLFSRRFANGFAVVNASASTQSITLPSGHTYTDVAGRPVSNPLTVNAEDAYMLTTGGNGCS